MADGVDDEITVPQETLEALERYIAKQDQEHERVGAPSLREQLQSNPGARPPYPGADNPMFGHLLTLAQERVKAGASATEVLINLGATAWMEGHIEGYTAGYSDAK